MSEVREPPVAAPRNGGAAPPPLPYPLDLTTFRENFTAFADPTKFPDTMVQGWLDQGYYMVNCGWGPMAGTGQGLWAAHEMAKLAMAAKLAASGDFYGFSGPMSNKSVGPVSVGYDVRLGYNPKAGPYNLTMYGQQYFMYAEMFGMGPIVSDPTSPAPPFSSPGGWWGPPFYIPGW